MSNGRKFTIEFKIQAVELVRKSEQPIARIAKNLDVGPKSMDKEVR